MVMLYKSSTVMEKSAIRSMPNGLNLQKKSPSINAGTRKSSLRKIRTDTIRRFFNTIVSIAKLRFVLNVLWSLESQTSEENIIRENSRMKHLSQVISKSL